MKRVLVLLLPALVLLTAQSFAQPEDELLSPKLRITWEQFKKQYDEGKVVVVDVRDAGSFAAGHIPNARSIPLPQIEKRAAELKKLKKPIVLYCA